MNLKCDGPLSNSAFNCKLRQYSKDDVTEVSEGRQQLALAVILISLLILLPGRVPL